MDFYIKIDQILLFFNFKQELTCESVIDDLK